MRKTAYVLCLILLCGLIVNEANQIYHMDKKEQKETGVEKYVPTSNFVNSVKKENELQRKVAYLTFDDGPSKNTEKVLATLKEKNAVATFFLIGCEITEEREEIVKKEIAQGNAVGVHTYCHEPEKIYGSADGFLQDYKKTSECIRRIIGTAPTLHRFPWGSNNCYVSSHVDALHEKLKEMGVKSYDWNVSGEDSVGGFIPQETIFQNVRKDLDKYSEPIILLHDSGTMDNTAAVLGRIIDYIRGEGYEFGTLDDREEYLFPESWR